MHHLKDVQLLKMITVMVLVDIVILVAWLVLDPMQSVVQYSYEVFLDSKFLSGYGNKYSQQYENWISLFLSNLNEWTHFWNTRHLAQWLMAYVSFKVSWRAWLTAVFLAWSVLYNERPMHFGILVAISDCVIDLDTQTHTDPFYWQIVVLR